MASYNQEESDKPNPNLKEEVALKPELFNGKNIDNFHNLDFIRGIDLKKFNDDLCQHMILQCWMRSVSNSFLI